jgi:hypothetical protein
MLETGRQSLVGLVKQVTSVSLLLTDKSMSEQVILLALVLVLLVLFMLPPLVA